MKDFDWIEIAKAFTILFAVIDIIGNVPIIIKLKEKAGEIHSLKASIVAFILMLVFLFAGEFLLQLLGVNIKAFAVAGSLILFALAAEMIFGVELFKDDQTNYKIVSIVPLAFPLIAGAGTMTTLISLRVEFAAINIAVAVFLNMILVYATLRLTSRIEKLLGEGGIAILQKVFGIILLAIAVKLFADNAKELFAFAPVNQ
ncbi:MarC family protein [Paracrocinitomix mangrovi]|uniref:MarC family protein n=1 Tax=Paracrocinitomix mangrovi TaxID=2862509 RepID=UPI001C8D7E94|nr:MarC family protein [Paracrocinitomix mangrovi]UKN00645.1 MarC family protein [Paracrocinitomix mangrovi]